LLFGNGEVHGALRDAMRAEAAVEKIGNALKLVPPTLRDGAFDEFNNVVASALELDLANVLELGWRKYEALAEAARRSLDVPGEEQIVSLAEHRITSIHRPNVEIVVDNVEVSEIDLKIELTIELEAVCGVVSAGRLIALRSGRAAIRAALWCEGVLMKSSMKELDLQVQLGLGSGLVLVEPPGLVRIPDASEPTQLISTPLEPHVN
jgi:hypothetical protein